MNPFEMVVLIVAIVGISSVLKARYGVVRHKGEDVFVGSPRDDAADQRLRSEMQQLKDRIQVLERIVTDGDRNRAIELEREIEALRIEKETRR
ncbi:hypothetical protein [uncultured Sphingomonas sp.]|uniref:hypothetical protein n=1 Tax=uncultured Sphingomonas sp. TaxID=158754 RepID=UPI0025EB2468|nr:hypothetical protein [uncultured Sphingomonas sp.]